MRFSIKDVAHMGSDGRTEIGRFKASLNNLKKPGEPTKFPRKIPKELLEIYYWAKGYSKKDLDSLLELKNIYEILKTHMVNGKLKEKIISGEPLSKSEVEEFKLVVEILEKTYKLKYGEMKTVHHVLTERDIVRQIVADKKLIDSKEIKQDDNRRTE